MSSDIVSVTTSDHVRLHGRLLQNENAAGTCILIHGLASNFYSSRFLTFLGQQLQTHGWDALLVNTRGHDVLNTVSRGGTTAHLGAAYEDVSECTFDVEAWVRFAQRKNSKPVTLIGHSLGAIKSLYSLANISLPAVQQCIALSATRLNHDSLLASPRGDRFKELYDQSSAIVASGGENQLMRIDFPFPTWMSAGAYKKKYGPENRYDWFAFIDSIEVPLTLVFGELELERNPAFQGLRKRLEQFAEDLPRVDVVEVEGADHFYSGHFDDVWQTIARALGAC